MYTDIVVLKVDGYNAGLSFYNTGDNTINNIKLIKRNFLSSDNVITIGTIDAKKARVLTSSDLQNIDAGSFDEIQFDLLGYTITLDYNKQIKPFVATVEMNTISTDLYPGVAPEEVNFRVFINTNNINNEPFEISVDFDNKYSETIQTTTINGLKTINIPHTYTQKGVFFPKVTVRNLNLENTSSSSFNYLQLENPIKINYPVTQTINFYAGNNTVWTSNAVSSIIPVYDLKWDFDYKNSTFTKDKETNNNDNTNWIYLPASGNFTNNKVLQSTVALVASVNIDNLIYTDTAFQTINIFNPVIPKISFTPATKNIITDISSIPYPVNLSAAGSVSATGKPLNFRWYINQADSGSTESVRYKMSKQGKSTLQLLVTDGTYSNEITDSISLNFNVSYNPDAKLSRLEYFFDLEPGVGNGHSIPVNFQNSVLYANTTINCSNLSTGLHRIYFRAKDSSGKWSIPQSQIVIVQAFNPSSTQVTDAEYFFDQDPGYGNGIKMSVPAGNNVSISTLCNLQNITTGLHRVYFRVKDNLGNWSIPQSQLVIIQQSTSANKQLTDAEYFFDIDPGIGSGIKLPVQVGDSISVSTIENIKNITTGLHRIYFRVKDSSGNWGIPQSQLVIIQNSGSADNINYAEYFFDTDPGFGNATKFTITSSDDVLINETLNIENLVPGIHTLIVRVRDESGKWSIPVAAMFEVEKGIATDVNSFIANNENNYKIYGGKERLTVITPNKDINRKYQLKVYTLSGTLILGKHFVGSQKITINKGFYVVDILDDFHGNKITQKILTY